MSYEKWEKVKLWLIFCLCVFLSPVVLLLFFKWAIFVASVLGFTTS